MERSYSYTVIAQCEVFAVSSLVVVVVVLAAIDFKESASHRLHADTDCMLRVQQ